VKAQAGPEDLKALGDCIELVKPRDVGSLYPLCNVLLRTRNGGSRWEKLVAGLLRSILPGSAMRQIRCSFIARFWRHPVRRQSGFKKHNAGLVVHDLEEMAFQIAYLLSDGESRHFYGEQARKAAVNHLDWQVLGDLINRVVVE
jgi:hypothetical protein